jgi:FkbM family methyltransferase
VRQFVDEAASAISKQLDSILHRHATMEKRLADLESRLNEAAESLRREFEHLESGIAPMAQSIGSLSEYAEESVGKPIADLVTSERLLQGHTQEIAKLLRLRLARAADALSTIDARSQEDLLAIAPHVAILRPLVPYPSWSWDADWSNPDVGYQLRERIWQYFHDRRIEAPMTVTWYHGTRLRLFLGNDLSRQIYVGGCIDPNEFAFLDRFLKPGMTFVDAGANDGIYSLFAARRVGRSGTTWAFEPSKRELDRLSENLELNDGNVRVFPIALAEKTGYASLTIADYEHEGQNTLGDFAYDLVTKARDEIVELTTLDAVTRSNPLKRLDVLKLDVEGAELRALLGAVGTLREHRPLLLFEVSEPSLMHQGTSRLDLLDAVRAQDYTVYAFDRSTGFPIPAVEGSYSDNMLAVPNGLQLPAEVYDMLPPPPPTPTY